MPWLINATQLDKFRKNQKNVIIFDASVHHDGRDAKQEFAERHIVGAQYFDISLFSDPSSTAPHAHMVIRDEALISEKLSTMGIRNDYKIIFYDNSKLHTSCRALWMMKLFGHNPQQLYILDGGLHAWDNYGGKVDSGESTASPKQYSATYQPQYIRTLADMKTNLHQPTQQVLDSRHAVRYAGGPEPRPNLRAGHIPGSFCFPSTTVFDKHGYWKPLDKIRQQLTGIGFDLKSPAITTCGSATTAPILNFMLDLLDHEQHAVYNGSWTEWGAEKTFPGETSAEERPVKTCTD
jgi:thiosulfate/3-mercaptopyruvate sulfurtransferase